MGRHRYGTEADIDLLGQLTASRYAGKIRSARRKLSFLSDDSIDIRGHGQPLRATSGSSVLHIVAVMLARLLLLLPLGGFAAAESGIDAWLRYAPIPDAKNYHGSIPSTIAALNESQMSPVYTAGQELQQGISNIFGKDCTVGHEAANGSSVTVGTVAAYTETVGSLEELPELVDDGFYLSTAGGNVIILGQNERGALYGAFHYLELLAQGNTSEVSYASNPDAPIRWVNVSAFPLVDELVQRSLI